MRRAVVRISEQNRQEARDIAKKRKVTKTNLAIVSNFILCVTPIVIVRKLEWKEDLLEKSFVEGLCYVILSTSAIWDSLIYFYRLKPVRKAAKKLLCCGKVTPVRDSQTRGHHPEKKRGNSVRRNAANKNVTPLQLK